MSLDPNPLFRRIIVPWYDSDAACYGVIGSMLVVLLFGVAGIFVVRAEPAYRPHLWVPVLLSVLSAAALLSTIVRLVRRYRARYSR